MHLTGENSGTDPVETLRPLVAELRTLVDKLELQDDDAALARSLHAAQEKVAGPRAVVMLLGEREDLKRQFLERLLGPGVAELPAPTAVCTWLEYGETSECTVTMPLGMTAVMPLRELQSIPGERTTLSIRLPDPTLRGGLALIDIPAAERGEPDEHALDCIGQTDAWIYVLGPDYALSDAGAAWLARLPEHGERLEIVIEDAGAIDAAERAEARERLLQTLKERCAIDAPRLTLVDPNAAEGEEANVWHGRFATFHSVMMLRGRDHRLEKTRVAVGEALSKAEQAIDRELSITLPGPRQARLRLGLKEVQALAQRSRGEDKGEESSHETAQQSSLGGIWSGANERPSTQSPLTKLAEAMAAAMAPESAEAAELAAIHPISPAAEPAKQETAEPAKQEEVKSEPAKPSPQPRAEIPVSMEKAFGIPPPSTRVKPKRGVSVHLSGGARRLLPWAIVIAFVILLLCLALWALSPRGFLAREQPGEWEYHPPAPAPPPAALADKEDPPEMDAGAPLPDTGNPGTPDLRTTPMEKPSAAVRVPLVKPVPGDARAGAAPHRRHRHLLGLSKLWHWIRPDRARTTEARTAEE
jgi:hypothetical protein